MKANRNSTVKLVISIVLAVTFFAGAGVLAFLYNSERNDNSELRKQVSDLQEQVPLTPEEEVAKLTESVGRLYELPNDEVPVVATVEDVTKFEDQPFFENAENGDKLLIFNDAKWAFLYRPSSDKIINSGPTAEGGVETEESTQTPVVEETE